MREERVEHHHEQTQGGKEVRGKEGKRERTKRGGIKYSFRVAMSRQDHFPVTRDPLVPSACWHSFLPPYLDFVVYLLSSSSPGATSTGHTKLRTDFIPSTALLSVLTSNNTRNAAPTLIISPPLSASALECLRIRPVFHSRICIEATDDAAAAFSSTWKSSP